MLACYQENIGLKMKDFNDNDVVVGDSVIILAKNYRGFVRATIVSVSKKSVLVECLNTWNYSSKGNPETYRVAKDMFIKDSSISNE